jgi:hypothetical protein
MRAIIQLMATKGKAKTDQRNSIYPIAQVRNSATTFSATSLASYLDHPLEEAEEYWVVAEQRNTAPFEKERS